MRDEKEILEKCRKNDRIGQKALFDKYAPRMMSVCIRYTNSSDDAKDVLQEGFIKVFEKIEMYSGSGSLEGWIRKIMVNTALDRIRKYKHEQSKSSIDDVSFMLGKAESTTSKLAAKDLMALVNSLPGGYKTVFNLFAVEGYTHAEIGEMLNISENTSKSQYSRARAHLQKMLEQIETNVEQE